MESLQPWNCGILLNITTKFVNIFIIKFFWIFEYSSELLYKFKFAHNIFTRVWNFFAYLFFTFELSHYFFRDIVRFNLDGTQVSLIPSCGDIGLFITILFITYIGGQGNTDTKQFDLFFFFHVGSANMFRFFLYRFFVMIQLFTITFYPHHCLFIFTVKHFVANKKQY